MRQPLHIVRGYGAFLYDAEGRPYLDMVNNVCHVGHSHPRVVEAIARQAAVLNTNTRYLHPRIVELADRLTSALASFARGRLLRELGKRGQQSRFPSRAGAHAEEDHSRSRRGLPREPHVPHRSEPLQVRRTRRRRGAGARARARHAGRLSRPPSTLGSVPTATATSTTREV